jgi:hypothetical protein
LFPLNLELTRMIGSLHSKGMENAGKDFACDFPRN